MYCRVVELVTRLTLDQKVPGSSPGSADVNLNIRWRHRLAAQDTWFSAMGPGFKSPWRYLLSFEKESRQRKL